MGCFNRAEAGERQNAEAEAVEDLETIAAQFVLGCWSIKQEIDNLCGEAYR
jgi:hypothetical protein